MSADQVIEPSPRTAERPMAFRGSEFVNGWMWACALFVLQSVLVAGVFLVASMRYDQPTQVLYALLALVTGAAVEAVVVFIVSGVFVGFAWLLAKALASVRPVAVHAIAFALYGGAIGCLISLLAGDAWILRLVIIAGSAVAVALGWFIAARRALRSDRAAAEAGVPVPDAGQTVSASV